jgi:hypothetical protein
MSRLSAALAIVVLLAASHAGADAHRPARCGPVETRCRGARVGALVVDSATGADLFAHDADTLAPAST